MASSSSGKSNASSSVLLIAGVITATAAAGALLVYSLTRPPSRSTSTAPARAATQNKEVSSTSGSNVGSGGSAGPASTEPISKDVLCKVFQDITTRMQQVIMRLAQEEQRIMQSNAGSGITSEQLQRFLIQRFQEGVAEVETEVYKSSNVSIYSLFL